MRLKTLFARKVLTPAQKLEKINEHVRFYMRPQQTIAGLTDDQTNELYERLRPRITRANIMTGVAIGSLLVGGILLANSWNWNLPFINTQGLKGLLDLSHTFNVFNGKTTTVTVGGAAWWLVGIGFSTPAKWADTLTKGSARIVRDYLTSFTPSA